MPVTIELPSNLERALNEKATASGLTAEGFVRQVLERVLTAGDKESTEPFESGYGMWAKYGVAPSAEEIDENRRDMFRHFAQD